MRRLYTYTDPAPQGTGGDDDELTTEVQPEPLDDSQEGD